jgi:predicted dehydrogenase
MSDTPVRIAVVGAGQFGKHHLRVISQLPAATLVAAVDAHPAHAEAASQEFGCPAVSDLEWLRGKADAAIVAVPTVVHCDVACRLLEMGIDVLVEKPIAASSREAARMVTVAQANGRILQVGHLERFNPAVEAAIKVVTRPLFFEIHRLSTFAPRSLDVDVVLDLMIHDLDIVLTMVGRMPSEVRAAGIPVLSQKADIANVRLAFSDGCVANITASRVSTERVRKLRLFQPNQYVSIDYSRQDLLVIGVDENRQIRFLPQAITRSEPLRRQCESFLDCVRTRRAPIVDGQAGSRALEAAEKILATIKEHAEVVARSLQAESSPPQ